MTFGFQPVIPNPYYFQSDRLMQNGFITHGPQLAYCRYCVYYENKFRIRTAFEDMRRVCLFSEKDLRKDEETAKAEEMCSLLSVRLAVSVL